MKVVHDVKAVLVVMQAVVVVMAVTRGRLVRKTGNNKLGWLWS